MNLRRVTITGADESVPPNSLVGISKLYPFVEWGILISSACAGTGRFPSAQWIAQLEAAVGCAGHPVNLSLHVCGRLLRDMLKGKRNQGILDKCRGLFRRMQLNFHGEQQDVDRDLFLERLQEYLGTDNQIIFQIDGAKGQELLDMTKPRMLGRCVPLFDLSHGAGVLPDGWPSPADTTVYTGYAGGLGPRNLDEQLGAIGNAAKETPIWIDMETGVRSWNDVSFDLGKALMCLEISKPYISGS